MPDLALWIMLAAGAAGGVAVLRLAWTRPSRSTSLNLAGWGLLVAGAVTGAMLGGAWGVAIAALVGMTAALLVLAHAAATSPRSARAAAPSRQAGIAPAGEPLALKRRLLTFVITVPLGLAAALAFALGLRGALMLSGAGEANANAAALFAVPLAWGLLAYLVLLRERRAEQYATLALFSLALVVGFIPGS